MSTGPSGAAGAAPFDGATGSTGPQAPPTYLRPKFERMPAELKQRPNWVLWIPIWKGSKWTKRPIQLSGYGASTTNPKHWSSFDDVKEVYDRACERGYFEVRERNKSVQNVSIGGVGFVFDGQPDEDGLVLAGADFDKVISANGEVASSARQRIMRLGSYTEGSVSGTGLHVIVRARPLQNGVAHDGVEMYTTGRFFTMTGHAPESAQLVAAPDEFAALAKELRDQSGKPLGNTDPSPKQTADDEANSWFGSLPPEKQSEVTKYAALHIAKHSKLFELTEHGGNYQDYLKLTFAIARSGVPDAEDIFVEAASIAKDADPHEKLREVFQNCERAEPPINSVTIGTLLHLAQQHGADFDQWKRQLPGMPALPPNKRKPLRGGRYSRDEALELVNSHYLIGKSDQEVGIFRIKDGGLLAFTPSDHFKLDVANIFVRSSGGSGKPISVEKFWKENPRRHQRKIVFKPGGTTEPDELNIWHGFAVEPREGREKQERLLQHILLVICRRDKAKFESFAG